MKKFLPVERLGMVIGAVLLLGFAPVSFAGYIATDWEDSIDFVPDIYVPPAYTFTLDLTNDGFKPLEDLLVTYDLIVDLFDDYDCRWCGSRELAFVDLPGIAGDRLFANLSGTEFGGWSLAAALQLNVFGELTVTVNKIYGDFYLGGASLTGHGLSKVPEPGTLGLLGLGLAGLGMARRKKTV